MTIGKRLTLSFSLLLLLTVIVGGLSTWTMKRAAASATSISAQIVPENIVGARLTSRFGAARIAARAYALIYDPACIAKAKTAFDSMEAAFAEARNLAVRHPDSGEFSNNVNQARPLVTEYAGLVARTLDPVRGLMALVGQVELDAAATDLPVPSRRPLEKAPFPAKLAARPVPTAARPKLVAPARDGGGALAVHLNGANGHDEAFFKDA